MNEQKRFYNEFIQWITSDYTEDQYKAYEMINNKLKELWKTQKPWYDWLMSEEIIEDGVQNILVNIAGDNWERIRNGNIDPNKIFNYLGTCVRNEKYKQIIEKRKRDKVSFTGSFWLNFDDDADANELIIEDFLSNIEQNIIENADFRHCIKEIFNIETYVNHGTREIRWSFSPSPGMDATMEKTALCLIERLRGLEQNEISRKHSIPLGTVATCHKRAFKLLQECLEVKKS